jgi:hypothetical protein
MTKEQGYLGFAGVLQIALRDNPNATSIVIHPANYETALHGGELGLLQDGDAITTFINGKLLKVSDSLVMEGEFVLVSPYYGFAVADE